MSTDTNPNSPLVDEVALYLSISKAQVLEKIKLMKETLHKIWMVGHPETIDEIKDFYLKNELHFYNVIDFNTWSNAQQIPVDIQGKGITTAIDFGSGCGTTALYLAERGVKVDLLELSPQLLSFAKWRLAKKGFAYGVVTPSDIDPLKKNYDLVTCIDVLEHTVNPMELFYHFSKKAKYLYSTALMPKAMSQHLNLWPQENIVGLLDILGWESQVMFENGGRGFFKSRNYPRS